MKNIFRLFFAFSILFLYSCVEPKEDFGTEEKVSFNLSTSDLNFQKVKILEEKANIDSLNVLSRSENPAVRLLVAKAFASITDEKAMAILQQLSKDEFVEVKEAAIYSLGQGAYTNAQAILLSTYNDKDSLLLDRAVNASVLEAIGKCGEKEMLEFMATISTILPEDSLMMLAQTRSIYRFAQRGIVGEAGTNRMVDVVTGPEFETEARVMAANYLMRTRDIDLSSYTSRLLPTALNQKDPRVRMALASAISKTKSIDALLIYDKMLDKESDYRVLVNAIRGFSAFTFRQRNPLLEKAVKHKNPHVVRTALEMMLREGKVGNGQLLYDYYTKSDDWELKYTAAAGANKHLSWRSALKRDKINAQLKSKVNTTKNLYEKSLILNALSHDVQNQSFLESQALSVTNPVEKTASVTALFKLYQSEKFKSYFGGQYNGKMNTAVKILLKVMKQGDAGVIALISSELASSESELWRKVGNIEDLKSQLSQLSLPKEIETYNELAKLIAKVEEKEFSPQKLSPNHSTDWTLLQDTMHAVIETSKGNIRLELFANDAPGSVANFVDLAKNGFYKDKKIHRLVANFVIQDGCPRGDGYGGLDYSIRSELSQRNYYKAGMLGMASAGRHTEGTQWFITHSPTPHLDGRYTLFGQVVDGMEVLHALRLADDIKNIRIEN